MCCCCLRNVLVTLSCVAVRGCVCFGFVVCDVLFCDVGFEMGCFVVVGVLLWFDLCL